MPRTLEEAEAEIVRLDALVKTKEASLAESAGRVSALQKAFDAANVKAGEAESLKAKVDLYVKALTSAHTESLLSNPLDPSYLGLAPTLELGEDLKPTADSLKKLKEWREKNAVLFKDSGSTTPPPSTPSTPSIGAGGEQLTDEYFKKVRLTNRALWNSPAFQRQRSDYINAKHAKRR